MPASLRSDLFTSRRNGPFTSPESATRQSLEMKGGTTFHFVTDGIHAALQRAKDAAKDKDVRIGGGTATIRQYLCARLIDELHLAFRPIVMGSGENLFAGVDLAALGYRCTEHVSTDLAMHVLLKKTDIAEAP